MEETDNQSNNTLKPWLWKKGQSGNIMGRPKGKTMKEYAKQYLERMTDEERDEWLDGLNKEIVWKMSEGNPKQDTDLTSNGEKIDFGVVKYADINSVQVSAETIPTESTESTG